MHQNDLRIKKEDNEGKITVENVFRLAGNESEDSSAEEVENKEETTEKYQLSEGAILSSVHRGDISTKFEDVKDQGFTRCKALIVVGFRHMAFDIAESIVHLANRRG